VEEMMKRYFKILSISRDITRNTFSTTNNKKASFCGSFLLEKRSI
jgi:hypothetical protein